MPTEIKGSCNCLKKFSNIIVFWEILNSKMNGIIYNNPTFFLYILDINPNLQASQISSIFWIYDVDVALYVVGCCLSW